MPDYSAEDYWNFRYHDETNFFEWYCGFHDIKKYIIAAINKTHSLNIDDKFEMKENENINNNTNKNKNSLWYPEEETRILDFGCGTSLVGYNICRLFSNISVTGYDPSRNCVDFMTYHSKHLNVIHIDDIGEDNSKKRGKKCVKNLYYTCKFPSNRSIYDIIIDKGTIDSLICEMNGIEKCRKLINKTIRNVLKRNGTFLMISHNPKRFDLFDRTQWSYILKKLTIKMNPYLQKQSMLTSNANANANANANSNSNSDASEMKTEDNENMENIKTDINVNVNEDAFENAMLEYHETNEYRQYVSDNVHSILAPLKQKQFEESIKNENEHNNGNSRQLHKKLSEIKGLTLTDKEKREFMEKEKIEKQEELEKDFLLKINNPNISEIEKRRLKREKFELERKARKEERERMQLKYKEMQRLKRLEKRKKKLKQKQIQEMKAKEKELKRQQRELEKRKKTDLSDEAMLTKFHNYFSNNLVNVESTHDSQCYYHHSKDNIDQFNNDDDDDDVVSFDKTFYIYLITKLR